MIHTWEPSPESNRDILGLRRDGLLVCSIVRRDEGWQPVVPTDAPPMRPDDRAEVTRKLVELNGEIL
jgi:hypothetical protein